MVIKNTLTGISNTIKKFLGYGEVKQPNGDIIWREIDFAQLYNANENIVCNPYESNVFAYACIKVIADNIARAEYILVDKNQKGISSPITTGALYDLYENPNPYQNKWEFFETLISWYCYKGLAVIILERNSVLETPKAMYCFNPSCFTEVYGENNKFLGYYFRPNSTNSDIFISKDNVILLKTFNPNSINSGFAPTQPAQSGIDQDYLASKFNKAFFKNGAIVSGFLITKEELSDEAYRRMKDSFEDKHKGADKAHNIGILEGGVNFVPSNFTHKDMDFIGTKENAKKSILVAYKVPEVVLGDYYNIKSYEGINAVHRTFWHECLIPKIKYITSVFNSKLNAKVEMGKYRGYFDLSNIEALKEDFFRKTETAFYYFKMGVPFREINNRLQLGFDMNNVPYCDVAFIETNYKTAEQIINEKDLSKKMLEEPEEKPEEEDTDSSNEEKPDTKNKKEKKAISFLDEIKVLNSFTKIKETYDESINRFSKKFKEKFKNIFEELQEEIIYNLKKLNNVSSDDEIVFVQLYNKAELLKKLKESLSELYEQALETGRRQILNELDLDEDLKQTTLNDYYVNRKINRVNTTIINTIDKNIAEITKNTSFTSNEAKNIIIQELSNYFETLTSTHIETISVTESAIILTNGRYLEMSLQDVGKHQWMTAADERVRLKHKDLHGQVAVLGEYFTYNDGSISELRYPGDESAPADLVINCRCYTIPIK